LGIFATAFVPTVAWTSDSERIGTIVGLDPAGDNWLALRSAPSGSIGMRLAKLGPDTRLYVLERIGSWTKVELFNGTQGWVSSKYINCCIANRSPTTPATNAALEKSRAQAEAQLRRLVSWVKSAKNTAQEAVVVQQVSAALANIAVARMGRGNFHALSLLRQLEGIGTFSDVSSHWSATGTDGSEIVCIVSPTSSQILWHGRVSEMNPSTRRWQDNCALSAPQAQEAIRTAVAKIKSGLNSALRDPEGTRYRDVHLIVSRGAVALCGEINMRNGFGGFVGYGKFIATASRLILPDDELGDSVAIVNWPRYCANNEINDLGEVALSG